MHEWRLSSVPNALVSCCPESLTPSFIVQLTFVSSGFCIQFRLYCPYYEVLPFPNFCLVRCLWSFLQTCSRGVKFPLIPTAFREEVWYKFVPLGGGTVCRRRFHPTGVPYQARSDWLRESLSLFRSFDGLLSDTSQWKPLDLLLLLKQTGSRKLTLP